MKRIFQKTKQIVSKNKIFYSFLFLAIIAIPITGILVKEKQIITQYAANKTYTVEVTTTTIDQKPFSGATIILDPVDNSEGFTEITKPDGTAIFNSIPEGMHNVVVMYQGLKRAESTITLQGDNPNIAINLWVANQPQKEISIPLFLFASIIAITAFVTFLLLWYHSKVKKATSYVIPIVPKPHPDINYPVNFAKNKDL